MFWSKKKSDDRGGLPDLPSYPRAAPSVSDFYRRSPSTQEEDTDEIHSLPSFPDSPMKRGFSQSAIKEAVQSPEMEELPHLPSHEEEAQFPMTHTQKAKVIEIEEWKPTKAPQMPSKRKIIEDKPVFVRLDKFQSAKESLEIIKEKISEIDSLLQSIREIKMKEDQELVTWEKEMESIKARISSVTSEIFESAVE